MRQDVSIRTTDAGPGPLEAIDDHRRTQEPKDCCLAVKVHRDHHVEVAKALSWVPTAYLGLRLQARADSRLVKLFHRG